MLIQWREMNDWENPLFEVIFLRTQNLFVETFLNLGKNQKS